MYRIRDSQCIRFFKAKRLTLGCTDEHMGKAIKLSNDSSSVIARYACNRETSRIDYKKAWHCRIQRTRIRTQYAEHVFSLEANVISCIVSGHTNSYVSLWIHSSIDRSIWQLYIAWTSGYGIRLLFSCDFAYISDFVVLNDVAFDSNYIHGFTIYRAESFWFHSMVSWYQRMSLYINLLLLIWKTWFAVSR